MDGKNCYLLSFTSEKLANIFIEECGIPNNKKISDKIFNSCNTLHFLLGFLEGDGHQKINKNYDGYFRNALEISGIYEDVMLKTRQLLLDNNIWNTIRRVPSRKISNKEQFCITIAGNETVSLIDISNKFVKFENYQKTNKKNVVLNDRGYWIPIKKISSKPYDGLVYNLEIDNAHSYTANNIVAHNCIALMLAIAQSLQMHNIVIEEKKENVIQDDFFKRKLFINR